MPKVSGQAKSFGQAVQVRIESGPSAYRAKFITTTPQDRDYIFDQYLQKKTKKIVKSLIITFKVNMRNMKQELRIAIA